MRLGRTMVGAGLGLALAVATVAAPAAAAVTTTGRVAFVQGIPGVRVDVCVGTKEVASGVRYGSWVDRSIGAGTKIVRFRTAAAGKCTGTVRASKSVTVEAGGDLTIVASKESPKVLVFDNTGLGLLTSAVGGSYYALRHAGDMGSVTFKIGEFTPIGPTADPVWTKGQQTGGGSGGDFVVGVVVTRPDANDVIASTTTHFGGIDVVTRIEWILVGSNVANARLVTVLRDIEPV